MTSAAALAIVLLIGVGGGPASAAPARGRSRDVVPVEVPAGVVGAVVVPGSAWSAQQDPNATTTTRPSSTTVKRSGDPVSESQDAQVGVIVGALVIIALLLTICCVVFWRMTKPEPVPTPGASSEPRSGKKKAGKGGKTSGKRSAKSARTSRPPSTDPDATAMLPTTAGRRRSR